MVMRYWLSARLSPLRRRCGLPPELNTARFLCIRAAMQHSPIGLIINPEIEGGHSNAHKSDARFNTKYLSAQKMLSNTMENPPDVQSHIIEWPYKEWNHAAKPKLLYHCMQ